MSVRKISTEVALTGHKEYQAGIQDIRRELEALKSALKLTETEYKGNANSIAALEAKSKALTSVLEKQRQKESEIAKEFDRARAAQADYGKKAEELKEKISAAERKLEELKNTAGDTAEEQKALTAEIASLNKELEDTQAREKAAADESLRLEKQLNNTKTETIGYERELEKTGQYLEEAKQSADGTATSIDNMGKQVRKSGDAMQEAGGQAVDFGKEMSGAITEIAAMEAMVQALSKVLKQIASFYKESVEAAIEFESAMAGVAKTTDLTDAELSDMGAQIKEISTRIPIATGEFAGLVEVAGQLGIQKESLVDFAEVMANLGVATNMTGEEAAQMLAQFANITKMDAGDYSRLGSSIVALGNNTATTESKITEMAQRIAAAGSIAGMSEADMLGLSAAVTSLGIEAATGGTNMGKLISMIHAAVENGGDKLETFASVAGMSAAQFAEAWRDDAAGALNAFIVGLNDTERNGKSAISILTGLKINQAQLQTMTLSLAGSGNLLSNSLAISNKAWKENSALTKEAETRYETTESQIEMMKNSFHNLSITIGSKFTPVVREGAGFLTNLANKLNDACEQSDLLVPILTTLTAAVAAFTAAMALYVLITRFSSQLQILITIAKTGLSNPWVLAAAAIATAIAAIASFIAISQDSEYSMKNLTQSSRDLEKAWDEQNKKFEETSTEILATASMAEQYVKQLEELEQKTKLTAEEQLRWNALLGEISELVPSASNLIDQQTGSIRGGTAALRENIAAWKESAMAQARQEAWKEKYKAFAEAEVEAQTNMEKRAKKQAELLRIESEMHALEGEMADAYKDSNAANEEGIPILAEKEQRYQDLVDEYSKAESELGNLDKAIGKNKEVLEEHAAELGVSSDVLDGWAEGVVEAEGVVDQKTAEIQTRIEGLNSALDALETAYAEAYVKARESIDQQYGLFDKIEKKATVSTKELIKNLKSQSKAFTEYAENLKKAAELGVDQGLIASLSDGSVESMAILQGIVEDHGKSVDEINTEWQKLNGAGGVKSQMAEAMADAKTEYTARSAEIQREIEQDVGELDQSKKAKENGQKTMSAYAVGLKYGLPEVRQQAQQVAGLVRGTIANVFTNMGGSITAVYNGSHAKGLSYVPFDGYIAQLHKGERVLNAKEAQEYRDMLLAAVPGERRATVDYSPLLQSIRGALEGQRGTVTNKATIQFYGERPSPAKTARVVEKTMRRMLYGY